MKKIFFILTLLLAFSINTSAQTQEKRLTPQESARKDVVELTTLVGLKDDEVENFYRLFEMKYQILEDSALSVERKMELEKVMESKIRATLDSNRMSILEANKVLFDKLKK